MQLANFFILILYLPIAFIIWVKNAFTKGWKVISKKDKNEGDSLGIFCTLSPNFNLSNMKFNDEEFHLEKKTWIQELYSGVAFFIHAATATTAVINCVTDGQEGRHMDSVLNTHTIGLEMIYAVAVLTTLYFPGDLVYFMNQILKKKKNWKSESNVPRYVVTLMLTCNLLATISVIAEYLYVNVYVREAMFFESNIILLFVMFIYTQSTLYYSLTVAPTCIIGLHGLASMLRKMNDDDAKRNHAKELLGEYEELQQLVDLYNTVFGTYLIPITTWTFIMEFAVSVVFLTSDLNLPFKIFMINYLITAGIIMMCAAKKMTAFPERSIKLLKELKQIHGQNEYYAERVRALRVLKIKIGVFYFMNGEAALNLLCNLLIAIANTFVFYKSIW